MLILTRRPGERVVIGDEVTVTVMEVTGQTVRLGIDAPRGLPVYREEIWLAVKAENLAAAESSAASLDPASAAAAPAAASPAEASTPSVAAAAPSAAASACAPAPEAGAQQRRDDGSGATDKAS